MDRHEWAAATLAVAAGDRVLEIGTGHGLTAAAVCARLEAAGSGRLLGLDRSAKMTAAAERRNARHLRAGRAEFRTESWPGAELGQRRFDRVYAFNVRLLWRDADAVLAARRALRPEGLFGLFYHPPVWSPQALEELTDRARPLVEAAGLTVLDAQLQDSHDVRSGCLLAKRGR